MPAAAAIGIAVGTAVGAKFQSNAAEKSAKLTTDAANKGADLQAQSNREALDFQKQQAALDAARADAIQRANYQQWAAREGRMSSIGQALGLPARDIPAYQPLPGVSGASGQPAAAPTSSGGAWTPDFIKQQLAQTGQDASDQSVQYWIGKESELKAREAQLNQPGYALNRLRDPNSGKAGASMPNQAPVAPYSIGAALGSQAAAPISPALQMPIYQPRSSIGAYLGAR
jgi:hypothetical protein